MSNVFDLDARRRAKIAAVEDALNPYEPELPLHGGGGGGTSGPMVPIKDYIDKADEAVETRLTAKLDKLSTKGTVWAAVATILGVMLAVLAFAGDRFDAGLGLYSQVAAQSVRDRSQDEVMRRIDRKLDQIIVGQRLPPANKGVQTPN